MATESEDPGLDLIDRQIARTSVLSTEHLTCRVGGLGHAWHLVQPDWKPSRGVRAVAQQCSRCLAIKRYNCSTRYGLMLDSPRYEYPQHYIIHNDGADGPVLSANAVRAALGKRITKSGLPEIVPIDYFHQGDSDE